MTTSSRGAGSSRTVGRRRDFERLLQSAAASWFREREYAVDLRHPYCLADAGEWYRNIIEPRVASYIVEERRRRQEARRPFPLHKYLHHGLSSQAFLFNLVGPLIVGRDLIPLADAFAEAGLPWPHAAAELVLEYEDRTVFGEHTGQPTSFDLLIDFGAGHAPLFVECKLTEREFGTCSVFADGDCAGRNPASDFARCALHRMGRGYLPLMERHGLFEGEMRSAPTCILGSHYQFFRELLFTLEHGGRFVLLYDARSPTFITGAGLGRFEFLVDLLPTALRPRVAAVSVQGVVKAIERSGRHPWITEFRRKYGLPPA